MNVEGRGKVVVPRDKRIPLSQNVIWIFGRCTQAQWQELLKKKLSTTHNLVKRNPDDGTYDKWNISQTNFSQRLWYFWHQNWERGTIPLKNSFKGYGGGEGGPTHPVPMLHRRLIIWQYFIDRLLLFAIGNGWCKQCLCTCSPLYTTYSANESPSELGRPITEWCPGGACAILTAENW